MVVGDYRTVDIVQMAFRSWRPYSLPASLLGVFISAALAFSLDVSVDLYILGWVVPGILLLHIAANLVNDLEDYRRGIDTGESPGSSGMLSVVPPLTQRFISVQAGIFLTVAAGISLFLTLERGLPVLLMSLTGFFGAYGYSGRPFGLKYRGMGDILVFLMLGPLCIAGSYYTITGIFSKAALLLSLPVGAFITLILHVNNIRDSERDMASGCRTLANLAGEKQSLHILWLLLTAAYIIPVFLIVNQTIGPWVLIYLVSLFPAVFAFRCFLSGRKGAIGNMDKTAAKVYTLYALLLIAGLLTGGV